MFEHIKSRQESIAIDKDKDKEAIAIAIETNNVNILKVEDKALMIMDTVKADKKWLAFYCKTIHYLSEATRQIILEGARKANDPAKYYARAAKVELIKLGR